MKCLCNCFECNLQESNEDKALCAAFMAVRIASDNKKQIDLLIGRLNADKKGRAISNPLAIEDKPSKPVSLDGQGMEPM